MGLTFKENCPDIRNTKIVDIVEELNEYNINVDVVELWCSSKEVQAEYGFLLCKDRKVNYYDAIILAVGHTEFSKMGAKEIRALGKNNHVLYDLKYILDKVDVDMQL
jgi:UDP-N-acetyl-D-glucosamine/UDP-N-acetyl-D-galactosamine dehydrogenase